MTEYPALAPYEAEPTFSISETEVVGLGDKKIGQRFQALIDYTVVEKTKSFTILRIKFIHLLASKRKF